MGALAVAVPLALLAPAHADPVDPAIADGSAQRRLDAARARWAAAGLRTYSFRVERQCFCVPARAVIAVRRGRPVHPPAQLRDVATVPRLLRVVQRAIDGRVTSLRVHYGRRGVPRSISIDHSRGIADDEIGYSVDRVRPR
jgi:uncharacterized protein DUF6174